MVLGNFREIILRKELNFDILSELVVLFIISYMNNFLFDLCYVLLFLLEKVCKFDIILNRNFVLVVSVVFILIEFLVGFGDCCNLSDSLDSRMVFIGWIEESVVLI